MYFDDSSIFRTVPSCSHLFNSCATLEDNLFTSVAINRGPFAAVADALRYRWIISRPLLNSIRCLMEERFDPDGQKEVLPETIGARRSTEFDDFTDMLDQV